MLYPSHFKLDRLFFNIQLVEIGSAQFSMPWTTSRPTMVKYILAESVFFSRQHTMRKIQDYKSGNLQYKSVRPMDGGILGIIQ